MLTLSVVAFSAFLTACSGCSQTPAKSLAISPPFASVVAGDAATQFTANATGGTGVTWLLGASIGTLSSTSGTNVSYTPPATVAAPTIVQLTATLGGANVASTAYIVVQPKLVGVLAVIITTPVGTPSVTVTGPGGFNQTLTASRTFSDLTPGDYTVAAAPITASGTYVERLIDPVVNASPVTVSGGQAAEVSVSYSERPGTGRLWIGAFDGNNNAALMGLVPGQELGQLQLADERLLDIDTDGGALATPRFVAFDAQGNLWTGDRTGHRVMKFSAAQLATSGRVAPAVVMQDVTDGGPAYLNDPRGLAFDHQGDLWVSTANQVVVKYSNPGTYSGWVYPTPDVVISSPTDGGTLNFYDPFGLAFDRQGDLWVINYAITPAFFGFWSAVEYANPAQLHGSVIRPPDLRLVDDPATPLIGTAFAYPVAIAFDSQDNMWVSNTAVSPYDYVSVIPPAMWMDGGVDAGVDGGMITVPSAQITFASYAGGATFIPDCLAFDSAGDVWVSSQTGRALLELSDPSSLVGFVSVDAGAIFPLNTQGLGRSLGCFAFDPPIAGSPVQQ